MSTVRVGDIRIYYEIHGKGEPLFLIMGLGSDMAGWMFQIMDFSQKYKVIVFDNRGVGRTDAPDIPYSTKMMADDTIGLMDTLQIEEAHILGLSMGGFIAQEIAIKHPRRIKSLILATTGASLTSRAGHVLGTWTRMLEEGVGRETFTRESLSWLFTDKFFENSKMVDTVVRLRLSYPYPQPVHAYVHQAKACMEHDTRGRLGSILAPTLVLVGDGDILFPVKVSKELVDGIGNARLVVLEGGGHGFCTETPEKFNKAVMDFLEKQ